MDDDSPDRDGSTGRDGPTRRDCITYGGALVAGGLLAGCSESDAGSGGSTTAETTSADTGTPTPTGEQGTTATGAGGAGGANGDAGTPSPTQTDTSYSVEMAPVGTVEFDSPPERVTHYFPDYADMAVALGHGDSILSLGLPSRFHTGHYEELDGVSVDTDSITKLNGDGGIDKEIFFELDGDLHLIDPQWLVNNDFFGLDSSDVEAVSEKVSPFLGNTIFRRTDAWHTYRYYTLYGAFEKVARVHQELDRFRKLKALHDEFVARMQAKLPAADDRPNALLCWQSSNEPESFYPARLTDKGTNKKAFHDLGLSDALAGTGIKGLSESDRGTIDYETLLEVDPDSILVRGHEGKSRTEFEDTVLSFMQDHGVASELTAVQNGMVFRGGPIYAGPLHHLFLTERYAKLYFPEQYSGELFDRQRLSGIITGSE